MTIKNIYDKVKNKYKDVKRTAGYIKADLAAEKEKKRQVELERMEADTVVLKKKIAYEKNVQQYKALKEKSKGGGLSKALKNLGDNYNKGNDGKKKLEW